jgi:hypothetical protein
VETVTEPVDEARALVCITLPLLPEADGSQLCKLCQDRALMLVCCIVTNRTTRVRALAGGGSIHIDHVMVSTNSKLQEGKRIARTQTGLETRWARIWCIPIWGRTHVRHAAVDHGKFLRGEVRQILEPDRFSGQSNATARLRPLCESVSSYFSFAC